MADTVTYKLHNEPWRIKLNVNNPQPTVVLTNLYDLLIDDDYIEANKNTPNWEGNRQSDRKQLRVKSDSGIISDVYGKILPHDIIAYDTDLYNSDYQVQTNDAELFDNFAMKGIQILKPMYDSRAKPQKKFIEPRLFDKQSSDNPLETIPALQYTWSSPNIPIMIFGSAEADLNDPENVLGNSSRTILFKRDTSNKIYYNAYDKDAALLPQDLNDVLKLALWEDQETENVGDWANYPRIPPSVYPVGDSIPSGDMYKYDILLADQETTLQASLNDSLSAYTTMALNPFTQPNPPLGGQDLSDLNVNVQSNSFSYFSKMMFILLNEFAPTGSSNSSFWAIRAMTDTDWLTLLCQGWFQEVLKDMHVWVKCTFYADYVSPEEFNQDLNQDSNVVHSNLQLSSTGDFNRYDTSMAPSEQQNGNFSEITLSGVQDANVILTDLNPNLPFRSEQTRAYVPQTAPSVDLLSKKIVSPITKKISQTDTEETLFEYPQVSVVNSIFMSPEEVASFITSATYHLEQEATTDIFGSLLLEPSNRRDGYDSRIKLEAGANVENSDYKQLYHPSYFDPESFLSPGEIVQGSNNMADYDHTPVVIPKEGNLFLDGRIISPTIDELWHYIKRLVDGRVNDDFPTDETFTDIGKIVQKTTNDSGSTVLDTVNTQDTRIPIPVNYKFVNDTIVGTDNQIIETIKQGDPLSVAFKTITDGNITFNDIPNATGIRNNEQIIIDSFVNIPDQFSYTLYDSIKRFDKHIRTFDVVEYTSQSQSPYAYTRSMENFTPWEQQRDGMNDFKSVLQSDDLDNNTQDSQEKRLKTNQAVTYTSMWGPRIRPYSLRELELEDKQLKFNLLALARYLEANFSITSDMGKRFDNPVLGEELNGQIREVLGNIAHGTLYQFHKYFNQNVQDPNTVFAKVQNKNNYSTLNNFGSDVEFSDSIFGIDGQQLTRPDVDENGLPIEVLITESSVQPVDRAIYGLATEVEERSNSYSSQDVYMAADGTWRYLFDHVRIPVLNTLY